MPYTKDGIKYPRCTNIIGDCTDKSGGLVPWATECFAKWIRDNCPSDTYPGCYLVCGEELNQARFAYKTVSDKALDVGSEVHNAIETWLKELMNGWHGAPEMHICPKLSPQAHTAFAAFLLWADEHNLKPIELEKTVYGSRWAGTLDFYGYFDDKLYVIDWKTSKPKNKKTGKGIYPEMRYQVAAYRIAIEDEIQDEELYPEGCGVLRLDKETGMPDWNDTSKTFDSDLRVFNRMVDLYFERHPRIAKRFEDILPF